MCQCWTGKWCCVQVKVLMGCARFKKKKKKQICRNRELQSSRGPLKRTGNRCLKDRSEMKRLECSVVQNMLWVIGAHGLDNSTWGQPLFLKITPTDISSSLSLLLSFSQVDGQRNRTGSSPGPLVGLNVFNQLFVGGYDEYTPELLPLGSRFRYSFQGERLFYSPTLPFAEPVQGLWDSPTVSLVSKGEGV